MVQGDLGSGNVVLKPREGEKPEEKVGFGMLEIHACICVYIYVRIHIYNHIDSIYDFYLLYAHMVQ